MVKSSEVTPKAFVSRAPKVDPAKAPPLSTLIKVANRVASTPCRHQVLLRAMPILITIIVTTTVVPPIARYLLGTS